MSEGPPAEAVVVPYRWPNRWRARTDVCAILRHRAVTWVVRDLLEAAEGDAFDFDDDPGHDPLVLAEHVHARTWTLDQARRNLGGDHRGEALLHWLQERELSFTQVGLGNIVRLASPSAHLDAGVRSVHRAAEILTRDPRIDTGERRLFDWLLVHHWITRRGTEYAPAQSAVDAGLLAVVPRRLPHSGDLWPQVVITDTGLTELHAALGGTDSTVLDQETQP